jgi:hypothetical protein
VPAGSFFTFAVRYGPAGAADSATAVSLYFLAGPMGAFAGFGRATDSIEFDRILCKDRRGVFLFANVGDDSESPATLDYLVRRGYSYGSGDDQGLLFMAYQRDLAAGFAGVQRRLAGEKLARYVLPVGGGYFFVPAAAPPGSWWGAALFGS